MYIHNMYVLFIIAIHLNNLEFLQRNGWRRLMSLNIHKHFKVIMIDSVEEYII